MRVCLYVCMYVWYYDILPFCMCACLFARIVICLHVSRPDSLTAPLPVWFSLLYVCVAACIHLPSCVRMCVGLYECMTPCVIVRFLYLLIACSACMRFCLVDGPPASPTTCMYACGTACIPVSLAVVMPSSMPSSQHPDSLCDSCCMHVCTPALLVSISVVHISIYIYIDMCPRVVPPSKRVCFTELHVYLHVCRCVISSSLVPGCRTASMAPCLDVCRPLVWVCMCVSMCTCLRPSMCALEDRI